ncbi:MAG: hypothetical protein IPO58_03860 [Betaproteobacteria bacterium]|nr:hypothetical protein [Betaproteobacteria bacterium]
MRSNVHARINSRAACSTPNADKWPATASLLRAQSAVSPHRVPKIVVKPVAMRSHTLSDAVYCLLDDPAEPTEDLRELVTGVHFHSCSTGPTAKKMARSHMRTGPKL